MDLEVAEGGEVTRAITSVPLWVDFPHGFRA